MKRFFCLILLFSACKDVYNPPVKNININYLVVEGNIVAGNDSTFIHLSRTTVINDTSGINNPETNASIIVESEDGESYGLQNEFNGVYAAAPLNISSNKKYRLHIFTADGKEYASDYVPVKITPAIDSVSWKLDSTQGLIIYVNTHDATNSTQYYRWQHVSTWEHRAKQNSVMIWDPGINWVRGRKPEEQVYSCWRIDTSNDISIATTTGLSSDVVFEKPLVQIPFGGKELSAVYSIIVTQNALTKEAFEFWQNLQKNTEQIGTIFDPQPFADFGNMHCISDPQEPVIGFISACSVQQQRIYIYQPQVQWSYSFPACKDTIVKQENISDAFSHYLYLPVHPLFSPLGAILGDLPECADCRLDGGGTTVKPPYMP